jgi:hypothetical protein
MRQQAEALLQEMTSNPIAEFHADQKAELCQFR